MEDCSPFIIKFASPSSDLWLSPSISHSLIKPLTSVTYLRKCIKIKQVYITVNTCTQVLFGKPSTILTVYAWLQFSFMVSCTISIGTSNRCACSCVCQPLWAWESCTDRVEQRVRKLTWRIDFCMNAEDWFVCLCLKCFCKKSACKSIPKTQIFQT